MTNNKTQYSLKMYKIVFLFVLQTISKGFTQIPLPYDFESATGLAFNNFDGGTGTRVANPSATGINTSANVGRVVKNGGQNWGGTWIQTNSIIDIASFPYICMKVYSPAVGMTHRIKLEGGTNSIEYSVTSTVANQWENLCWNLTGAPNNNTRIVFLFNFTGACCVGNGTAAHTFYFDDIYQSSVAGSSLPNSTSTFFCPTASITMTSPSAVEWWDSPTGGTMLGALSTTFVTPVMTGSTTFYTQSTTPIPGGTLQGWLGSPHVVNNATGTAGHPILTVSYFTAKAPVLTGKVLESIQFNHKILSPTQNCVYTYTVRNITTATDYGPIVMTCNSCNDNSNDVPVFNVPLTNGHNYSVTASVTGAGGVANANCRLGSHNINTMAEPLPTYPVTSNTYLNHTSHWADGVSNNRYSTMNWVIRNPSTLPPRYAVNAIANCSLPITLIDFTVNKTTEGNLLNWTTSEEVNNDYFEVRKSIDGINFVTIGVVQGNNNTSSLSNYSFVDGSVSNGTVYYQLIQFDKDGNQSESELVFIGTPLLEKIEVYPNPSSGQFTISNLFASASNITIKLYDAIGKEIISTTSTTEAGLYKKEIDLTDYTSGVYTIHITTDNESKILKIYKNK